MNDLIPVAIIVLVAGSAIWYILKAKKSGKKCIGCPDGCSCAESKQAGCFCGGLCGGVDNCNCHNQ